MTAASVKKRLVSSVRRTLSLGDRLASTGRKTYALLVSLFAMVFLYRVALTISLFVNDVKPFDFNPKLVPVWFMIGFLPYDLLLIGVIVLLSFAMSRLSRAEALAARPRLYYGVRIGGIVLTQALLVVLLTVHATHVRLLFEVQTGFEYYVVRELFFTASIAGVLKQVPVAYYLAALVFIGVFWLIALLPHEAKVRLGRVLLIVMAVGLLLSPLSATLVPTALVKEIRLNPVLFLLSDIAAGKVSSSAHHLAVDIADRKGMQLVSPEYINEPAEKETKIIPLKSKKWNVVYFILESVGTRYVFDTKGGPAPMPFFQGLMKEGWYLKNHYAASNISSRATFSLLSGLYDYFDERVFCIEPHTTVPSIYSFVKDSHESFLVTPASTLWYFPDSFLRNSGIREIHHLDNLTLRLTDQKHEKAGHYMARDEIQTVDFFIDRIKKAKGPFVGVYISFLAHFPYFDYGPAYRVRNNCDQLICKYLNNLALLDRMIQKLYDSLKEQNLLDSTILVIAGDHGQAFGQHVQNNYLHYHYSYTENLQAPALLYQPDIFKPRVIEAPTSHVDIVPTLLDAMRVPFDPLLLAGESLFAKHLRRKYIFMYGQEKTISSLSADLIKVSFSLRDYRSWAFDLKSDPGETRFLPLAQYEGQLAALKKFAGHTNASLKQYSAANREKKDFHGHRHPRVSL